MLFHLRFHLNSLFWRNSSVAQRGVAASFGLILCGVATGVWFFAYNSFRFLKNTDGGGVELMLFALFIGLTFLFALFLISSIATFGGLAYYANDLPFFFSLPINPIAIAQEKIAENVILSGWGVLLLGTPIVLAFGSVAEAGILYYILAFLGLTILCILSAALGSVLSMVGFVTFSKFPRTWSRVLILVLALGTLKLLTMIVLPDIQLIERIVSQGGEFALQSVTNSVSHLSPAYALSLIIGQSVGLATSVRAYAFLLLQIGVIAFLAIFAARYLYYRGWQLSQVYISSPLAYKSSIFNTSAFLLEKRELLQLWRELRSAPQLIFTGILVGFYFLLLPFARHMTHVPLTWQWFIMALLVGVAGYVLATVALRFVFPSMSLESKASWLLWSMPVDLKRILQAKWTVSLGLMGALSIIMASAAYIILPADGSAKLILALHIILLGIMTTLIQLGFGLVYANFHESDPGALSTTGPGLLVTVASLVIVALDVIVLKDDFEALSYGVTWSSSLHILLLVGACVIIAMGLRKRAYAAAQKYSF